MGGGKERGAGLAGTCSAAEDASPCGAIAVGAVFNIVTRYANALDFAVPTADEFDRAAACSDGIEADLRAVELSRVAGRSVRPIPFRQLASFSGIVRGNRKAMADIFRRLGTPYSESEFAERLDKAENWLRTWAPEEDVRLSESKRLEYFACLPAERKAWINALKEWVSREREITVEAANQRLYEIPQSTNGTSGDQRKLQKTFFTDVYQLLFAKDSGPRLATFLAAVPKEDYLSLIDFTAVAA